MKLLEISPTAKISPLADIEKSIRESRIIIKEGVVIDAFVKIKPVGGSGDVVIGSYSYINSGTVIYSGNGITIGSHCLIAANCTFAPVNHEFKDRNQWIHEQRFQPSKGGITVEDDVWIGSGAVILDGAILRKGCVVGALTLIRGEVPPYSINVGNPSRIIGYRK